MGKSSDDQSANKTFSAPRSFWAEFEKDAKERGLKSSTYLRIFYKEYKDLKENGTPTSPRASVAA